MMMENISARILTAATLAEQHGQRLARFADTYGEMYEKLLLPDGPSHWGAMGELLRAIGSSHKQSEGWDGCTHCDCDWEIDGCPTIAALLPLADQIIRDLG